MVVRDVAAGTQQATHRPSQTWTQPGGDQIEDGRATGRQQHLVGVEQLLGVDLARDGMEARHQRIGHGFVVFGVAGHAQAFVAFDADQGNRCAAVQGARQLQRRLVLTQTAAPARHAQFQQHLERWRAGVGLVPGFDQGQLSQRIDQENHAQAGVLTAQALHRGQVRRLYQLVGDQRPLHAGRDADGQLVHRRKSHAPGAGRELALEQFG